MIGYSGSGKSTLAQWLSKTLGCPVMHLDQVQFQPGWKERETEEARKMVRKFMNQNDWIIDGNYSKFYYERRMKDADLIIFMNFSRFSCMARALKRLWRYRGKVRESAAPGCVEKMDAEFIKWILWDGRTKKRKRGYRRILKKYKQKTIVLHHQKELDQFKRTCREQRC